MAKGRKNYLTGRQKQILEFIREFRAEHGISPTHLEIRERFGFSSYGTVYKHLKLLENKGFLTRDANQKRGIELVERDDVEAEPRVLDLPFFGKIAAGRPIEAIAGDDSLGVPSHLLGKSGTGEHYVLRVSGDSMIDEGIFDGDYVVVQLREQAEAGEMVVALINDENATLKHFFPEGERVRLQPANPTMDPIYVPAGEVKIQGIVVGLMRKFA